MTMHPSTFHLDYLHLHSTGYWVKKESGSTAVPYTLSPGDTLTAPVQPWLLVPFPEVDVEVAPELAMSQSEAARAGASFLQFLPPGEDVNLDDAG